MMTRIFQNSKWGLLIYFALSSAFSIVAVLLGIFRYEGMLTDFRLWVGYLLLIIILCTIVGYAVAQRMQRRIDAIHDSMLQVSRDRKSVV